MLDVDAVSLIAAAALATYTSYRVDKLKREDESINIVKNYQDPLLIAAVTLRHKLVQFRNTPNIDRIPKKPVIPARPTKAKAHVRSRLMIAYHISHRSILRFGTHPSNGITISQHAAGTQNKIAHRCLYGNRKRLV